jgi:hypothetical protein
MDGGQQDVNGCLFSNTVVDHAERAQAETESAVPLLVIRLKRQIRMKGTGNETIELDWSQIPTGKMVLRLGEVITRLVELVLGVDRKAIGRKECIIRSQSGYGEPALTLFALTPHAESRRVHDVKSAVAELLESSFADTSHLTADVEPLQPLAHSDALGKLAKHLSEELRGELGRQELNTPISVTIGRTEMECAGRLRDRHIPIVEAGPPYSVEGIMTHWDLKTNSIQIVRKKKRVIRFFYDPETDPWRVMRNSFGEGTWQQFTLRDVPVDGQLRPSLVSFCPTSGDLFR